MAERQCYEGMEQFATDFPITKPCVIAPVQRERMGGNMTALTTVLIGG